MAKKTIVKSKKSASVEREPWPKCGKPKCGKDSVMFHRRWTSDTEFVKVHTCSGHAKEMHAESAAITAQHVVHKPFAPRVRKVVKRATQTVVRSTTPRKKRSTLVPGGPRPITDSPTFDWDESDVHDDEKMGRIADESASEFAKKLKGKK